MKKFALVMMLALALPGIGAYADEGRNVSVSVVNDDMPGPWLLYQDGASWKFYNRYKASEEPFQMATHFAAIDRYDCLWSVYIFEDVLSEKDENTSIEFVNRTLGRSWRLLGDWDILGAFTFYMELDEDGHVIEIAAYSEDGAPMNGYLRDLIELYCNK